jgi:hypothetical protein
MSAWVCQRTHCRKRPHFAGSFSSSGGGIETRTHDHREPHWYWAMDTIGSGASNRRTLGPDGSTGHSDRMTAAPALADATKHHISSAPRPTREGRLGCERRRPRSQGVRGPCPGRDSSLNQRAAPHRPLPVLTSLITTACRRIVGVSRFWIDAVEIRPVRELERRPLMRSHSRESERERSARSR